MNSESFSDLKSNNIALTADGNVRLLDFGHSRFVEEAATLPRGAPIHTAPEITDGRVAGLPSDIYSYGVTLAEMFYPFRFLLIKSVGNWWIRTGNSEADKLISLCLLECCPCRPRILTNHKYFDNVSEVPSFIPGRCVRLQKPDEKEMRCAAVTNEDASNLIENALRIPSSKYLKQFP